MNRRERLELIERGAASSIGASIDDTLWLVQRIRALQDLVRATDRALVTMGHQLRNTDCLANECRQALRPEQG